MQIDCNRVKDTAETKAREDATRIQALQQALESTQQLLEAAQLQLAEVQVCTSPRVPARCGAGCRIPRRRCFCLLHGRV
jgi:hypothetical protein